MKGNKNKEVEKSKKVYQVVMDEKIHHLLKKRSKDYKIKIGDFVEELVKAFELKMQNGLDLIEVDDSFPYINGVIFQLLKTGSINKDWSKEAKGALIERGRFLKEQALLDGWKQSDIIKKDKHDYYDLGKYMDV